MQTFRLYGNRDRLPVLGGKCGCPACGPEGLGVVTPRQFWKGRKNRHNRSFGRANRKSAK